MNSCVQVAAALRPLPCIQPSWRLFGCGQCQGPRVALPPAPLLANLSSKLCCMSLLAHDFALAVPERSSNIVVEENFVQCMSQEALSNAG